MDSRRRRSIRHYLRCFIHRCFPFLRQSAVWNKAGFDRWYTSGRASRLLYSPTETIRYEAVLRHLAACRQNQSLRILDAGCGNGRLATMLNAAEQAVYLGVDFSRPAIEQARSHAPNATFTIADLPRWHPSTRFDVIIFNEVTYYLPAPRQTLRDLAASLKPGGRFIVSVFQQNDWLAHWRELEHDCSILTEETVENTHGLKWTVKTLDPRPPPKIEIG